MVSTLFHTVLLEPAAELAKVSALSSLQVLGGAKLKLDHPPELAKWIVSFVKKGFDWSVCWMLDIWHWRLVLRSNLKIILDQMSHIQAGRRQINMC